MFGLFFVGFGCDFGVLFCWLVLSLLSVFVLPWFVMFGFIGLLGIGWFVD